MRAPRQHDAGGGSAGRVRFGRGARAVLGAAVLALAAATATGCGERDQTLQLGSSSGTYQGKPDGKPWDNSPTSYGSSQWPQGDRGAWERAIKARNQAQNEYVRTQ